MKTLRNKLLLCAMGVGMIQGLMAQVTIEIPYKPGDIEITAKVKYSPSVKSVDSVRLECNYGKEYTPVTIVQSKAKELLHRNTMKHRFDTHRKYRVAVYNGGNPIYSNEVAVEYSPEFKYTPEGLPIVTNIRGEVVEKKDGYRYIRLKWNPVPKAFAYKIYVKSPLNEMVWDVSVGDVGFVFEPTYDYFVATKEEITFTFTIAAVQGPNNNHDSEKMSQPYSITLPNAYVNK